MGLSSTKQGNLQCPIIEQWCSCRLAALWMVTTLTPGRRVTMVGLTLEGTQMFQSSKQSQVPAQQHLTPADVDQPLTFRDTGSRHSKYYF